MVLGLVIGVSAGAAIAALAGARRTDTAYDRLLEATDAPDVSVGLAESLPDPRSGREIIGLPQVARGDTLVGFGAVARGRNDEVRLDRDSAAILGAERGLLFEGMGRLKVEEGRLPRPDRVDEALADRAAVRILGLGIGDRYATYLLDLRSFISLNEQASMEGRPPTEAELAQLLEPIELTIVGTGRAPENIVGGEGSEEDAGLIVSPTFVDRHRDVAGFTRTYVDLQHPERDLPAFSTAIRRAFPDEGASLTARATNAGLYDRSTEPYVRSLQLFALVLAIAAVLVLGQAIARQTATDVVDAPLLRALGFRPRDVVLASAARGVLAAVVGALVALVVAFAASPLFPLGLGRQAEPDPGLHADWVVLGAGLALIVVVVTARALLAAWAGVRAARRAEAVPTSSGPRGRDRVAGAGVPPSVAIGVGWALQTGRGARRAPLWTALPGLVAAVVALVAALGFGASLDHLVSSPKLYGWNWDVSFDGFDVSVAPAAGDLDADRDLRAWATGARGAILVDGDLVPAVGIGHGRGTIAPRITDGRPPADDGELALGARTLAALDRSVGDTVEVEQGDGGRRLRYRIVGRSVTPSLSLGENVGVADGAVLTLAGLRRVDPGSTTTFFLVEVRPGTLAAVQHRYGEEFGVLGPQRPREILSFDRVRSTPVLLATLLALMGAAALAHALLLAVRDERRELAVLKTLGFTRGQVSATVAAHATTLVLLALAIGVPLGLAAGRWSWELFIGPLGLDAPSILPVGVVGIVRGGDPRARQPRRRRAGAIGGADESRHRPADRVADGRIPLSSRRSGPWKSRSGSGSPGDGPTGSTTSRSCRAGAPEIPRTSTSPGSSTPSSSTCR